MATVATPRTTDTTRADLNAANQAAGTTYGGTWVDPATGMPVGSPYYIDSAGNQVLAGDQVAQGGQFTPFNPTGQNVTGGNSTVIFYTDPKTGQVTEVDKQTGRVLSQYTADQWAQESQRNGVLSGGEFKEGVNDLMNQVPTPLIDQSTKEKINNTLVDVPDRVVGGANDILNGNNPLGGAGGGDYTQSNQNIQDAINRQAGISDAMGAAAANYQNVAAPTVSGPGSIQAALAAQQDPIQAAIAQAQQAQAAQQSPAVLAQQQAAIQAQQVQAAQIAQAQQAQTARIGPVERAQGAQIGPTALTNAAQMDLAQQAQIRAQQQGLIGGLQDTIAGKSPSVAEIMLRNATDRNVANQYALAQAANGMNTGLAQRTAMINAAEMNQNAVMQQALLRAQEIATAQGQLGGVLQGTRGADVDIAGQQAGLQQQANLANQGALNTSTLQQAQLAQQAGQFNAGQANTAALQQAQLAQSANQFNAGQVNDISQQQAQLQQAAALANQNANLQAGTTNATLAQQVALANAGAQNTVNQQNAQLEQAANLQNAQLGTQANIANAGNITGANTASAQLANAVNLANANNQSQANTTAAQLNTQADIASANNQVSTNALNQKAINDYNQNQIAAAGQAGQTSVGGANAAAEQAKADAAKQAALIQGISAGAAALISDPKEKTGLRSAEAEIAGWTSTLEPSAFKYKDGKRIGAAPGQRFGITTEDLKKSRVGRSLVRKLPDGTESVDVGQSVGAILATLSAMNRRIDKVATR